MSKNSIIPPVIYSSGDVFIQANNSHELMRVMDKVNELYKPAQRLQTAEFVIKAAALTAVSFVAIRAIHKIFKQQPEEEDRK